MADPKFDVVPVKLPSGSTAVVHLPRVFTLADGVHLMNFLTLYLTDKAGEPLPLPTERAAEQADAAMGEARKGGAW